MAIAHTRLLLLGIIKEAQPVNGYQIRQISLQMQLDKWANVSPESIYSGVHTLEKHGYVVGFTKTFSRRTSTAYALTPAGEDAFFDLFTKAALNAADDPSRLGLYSVLTLAPCVEREFLIDLLQKRCATMKQFTPAYNLDDLPPHLQHLVPVFTLVLALGNTEIEWLKQTIVKFKNGAGLFKGELDTATDSDKKIK